MFDSDSRQRLEDLLTKTNQILVKINATIEESRVIEDRIDGTMSLLKNGVIAISQLLGLAVQGTIRMSQHQAAGCREMLNAIDRTVNEYRHSKTSPRLGMD